MSVSNVAVGHEKTERSQNEPVAQPVGEKEMPQRREAAVSVDFGGSSTVVAIWNEEDQCGEVLSLPALSWPEGRNAGFIPTVLFFEKTPNERIYAGYEVIKAGLESKNHVGAVCYPFDSVLDRFASSPRGDGVRWSSTDQNIPRDEAVRIFATRVLESLNSVAHVQSLTLTAPVNSFEDHRLALSDAAAALNLSNVCIIDHSTAAALSVPEVLTSTSPVLIVDWGASSLDVALIKLGPERVSQSRVMRDLRAQGQASARDQVQGAVVAKAGRSTAGDAVDLWILHYIAERFRVPHNVQSLALAERIKRKLLSREQVVDCYTDETRDWKGIDCTLTRKELAFILEDNGLSDVLRSALDEVARSAQAAGVGLGGVQMVVLTGGTTLLPGVSETIESALRSFQPAPTPTPIQFLSPADRRSGTALGAARLSSAAQLQDILYHGYGLRYWDMREERHKWIPLLEAGLTYPTPTPRTLVLGASLEGQTSLELIFGELPAGAQDESTEVFFDPATNQMSTRRSALGSVLNARPLNDGSTASANELSPCIVPLDPPANPGSDCIRVDLAVDQDRFLRVTVTDIRLNAVLFDNRLVRLS